MRALSRFNVLKASRCALLELLSCGRRRGARVQAWPLTARASHRCNRCKHHASRYALPRGDRRSRELHYGRDIHRLTGTINVSSSGTGGGASASRSAIMMRCRTTVQIAGKGVERKITAALNCKNVTKNIGGSARIVGTLTRLEFLQKGNIVAIFIQGPNKPAPPPPPPIPPPPPAYGTERGQPERVRRRAAEGRHRPSLRLVRLQGQAAQPLLRPPRKANRVGLRSVACRLKKSDVQYFTSTGHFARAMGPIQ